MRRIKRIFSILFVLLFTLGNSTSVRADVATDALHGAYIGGVTCAFVTAVGAHRFLNWMVKLKKSLPTKLLIAATPSLICAAGSGGAIIAAHHLGGSSTRAQKILEVLKAELSPDLAEELLADFMGGTDFTEAMKERGVPQAQQEKILLALARALATPESPAIFTESQVSAVLKAPTLPARPAVLPGSPVFGKHGGE